MRVAAAALVRMRAAAAQQRRAKKKMIAAVAMKELAHLQRRAAAERRAQLAAAADARREALREMRVLVNEAEASECLAIYRPPPVIVPDPDCADASQARIFYTPKHAAESSAGSSVALGSPFPAGFFSPAPLPRGGGLPGCIPRAVQGADRALMKCLRKRQITIPVMEAELTRDVYDPYGC
jgi:hypothetical protein